MTKLEAVVGFETACEKYDIADMSIKELKRERLKIRNELLKVNNCLLKTTSESEKEKLENDKQALIEEREAIGGYIVNLKREKDEMLTKMKSCYRLMFSFYDATVYPDEIKRMLKEKTGKTWEFQNIYHYDGAIVGVALVSEKSEHFKKKIYTHVSLAENKIFLENENDMKVVFSAVAEDSDALFAKWNWTKFYLYATSAFYDNEKMKEKYHDFLTRDFDFAEFVCYGIRDELFYEPNIFNSEEAGEK